MVDEIDSFLDGGEGASEREPEPRATPAADPPAEVAAKPQGKDAASAEAKPAPGEAAADPGAEPEPSEPGEAKNFRALRKAVEDAKKERADHKGRADRLEGELEAIRRQMAERDKPQPQAAPEVQEHIPSPLEDPVGFAKYMDSRAAHREWNNRLNISETLLRRSLNNDADVDAKVEKFKALAAANPALRDQLSAHRDPYQFAYDTGSKALELEAIGDPKEYRQRTREELKAEARAELLAEMEAERGGAPAGSVVQLPSSLTSQRSAGARSTPVLNVPESFADILNVGKR